MYVFMCFSSTGTYTARDMCLPGRGTHITRDNVFQVEEHRFIFSVVEFIMITLVAFIIFKCKKWMLGF